MINRDCITIYKKDIGLDYRLDPTHYIEYTFEDFKKELDEAGIDIVEFELKFAEIYAVCKGKR